MVKKIVFLALALLFLTVSPVSAGWGAGWGSGSVIGFGTVTGLKNAKMNGATVLATISSLGSRPNSTGGFTGGTGKMPGIIWCGNPGKNGEVAPGVNTVVLPENFSGTEFVTPDQIDKNGKAPFNVHATLSDAKLNSIFDPSVLCPNGNWTVLDYVPQSFSALLQGFDSNGVLLTQAVYDCQMPWSTLLSLGFKQQSPYTCTEVLDARVH